MIEVTSPFDGTLLRTVETKDEAQANAMLDSAVALYKDQDGWLSAAERIAVLNKLASLMANEAEELALQIASEGGKPLIDARVEVARAIDGVHLAVKELGHIMSGEEIPMGLTAATVNREAHTVYEPIGVVLALSAFNHPLNLIVHQVVPAIAVGCPVIVKPASATPLSCLRFCELVQEAGLPEGWVQPIVCSSRVADMMAGSDKIAFMAFIGSGGIGWMLKSQLAPGVRCALEHGGVAPVIVHADANLDKAVPALVKGGFYHAGQVCVSVQRIYAPASLAEDLANKIAAQANELVVGDPTLATTDVGPLIKPGEVKRVTQWVEEAVAGGATLVCGGEALSETTYKPTVLLNPPAEAMVSTEEVFGPVVCIYSYDDVSEAIAAANGLKVAFQSAVWGENINEVKDTAKRLDASAVMINDHTAFRADWMPFAGRRYSGYGIGGIGYTMHDMVQHKMTVINYN